MTERRYGSGVESLAPILEAGPWIVRVEAVPLLDRLAILQCDTAWSGPFGRLINQTTAIDPSIRTVAIA